MKKQFLSILLIFCLILSNSYMVLALDGNVPVVQADESEDELEALDYVPPQFSVTGISPDTINFGEQPVITITGKNLTSDMAVWLGTEEVTSCTANAAGTQLTFTAPQLPVGTYSVNVTDGEDFVMLESAVLTCVDGSVDVQFGTPAEDAAEFEIPVTLSARGEVTSLRAEISIPKDIFAEINVELSDAVQELDNVPGLTSRYNKATEKLIVSMAGSEDFNVGDSEVFTIRLRPQSTQTPFNIHVVVETVEVNGISVLSDSISIPVTIYANYALSASVKYYKDRVGVEGVKIYADNAEGLTNANGDLELSGIHGTDITVHAVKKDYIPHTEFVIGTNDALMILRYTVGEIALTDQQKMAADVDANGRINEVDASLILKYAVGLTRMFPAGPWKFIPAETDMTLQPEGNEVEFTAILMGDVDGSYSGEAYEGTVIPDNGSSKLLPFIDVDENSPYYNSIVWAYNSDPQIYNGISDRIFGFGESCNRGIVASSIWRFFNSPEPSNIDDHYTDVSPEDDYYKAVFWLLENSISDGTSPDKFTPSGLCKNAHVITFLWRAFGEPGHNVNAATWYEDAYNWAEENDLLSGTLINSESLNNQCTIEDLIKLLYNSRSILDELPSVGPGSGNHDKPVNDPFLTVDPSIFEVPEGAHLAEDCVGFQVEFQTVTMELIENNEDALIDLRGLLGHSITYYHDEKHRIVAVDEVETTTITGKLNYGTGKIGEYRLSEDCDFDPEWIFVNGYESDWYRDYDLTRINCTWNVVIKNDHIDRIVSVMIGEVTEDKLVTAEDISEIFDEDYPSLLYVPFKVVEKNGIYQIDMNSFALYGVESLSDIQPGNVVYVYAGSYYWDEEPHITRIMVGTETVPGVYDEVAANGKWIVINDKEYRIANEFGLKNSIQAYDLNQFAKAGIEGTAYLDYFGNFYYLKDKEVPESNYCVVLKTQVVGGSGVNGTYDAIDANLDKIKVFTADGEEKIYLVNARNVDKAAESRDGYFWWEEVEPGAVVKLAFDANGKVSAIRCVEMDDSGEIEVRSDGFIPDFGGILTDSSVIFYLDGYDDYDHMMDASRWSVLDPKLLWGKQIEYMRVSLDAKGVVKAAVIIGNSRMFEEHVEKYGIIKSYSEIKDYAKVQMLIDGEAVSVKWSADECDFDLLHRPGQRLYRMSLASNEIVSVEWFEPDDERTFVAEEITGSAVAVDDYNRMFVNMYGENLWLPLAEDCVVYVYDESERAWMVKTISYLDGLRSSQYNYITLYDTNSKDKEFYNVVVVVRE